MHVELTILRIAAACLAAGVVIWLFDVLVVVALAGVATALLGRSWSWRVPGASFALGVAAQIPFNRAVDPSDIEETLGLAGYVLLLAALGMTVVAAGRGEVPYFLAIWAVATFGYAVGGFLDSNWASRPESAAPATATKTSSARTSLTASSLLGYSAGQGLFVSFPLLGVTSRLLGRGEGR